MSSYIAINASAGSGKTYTLVQRILMICLSKHHQPDTIRRILALTFTNKAANEMKERILNWLEKFCDDDYMDCTELLSIQKAFQENGINITIDELHRRAKTVLDYILHHYSTLNIETIDKFNSRLVRSFSYELGLAQNFNLEIDTEPFLTEAVDLVLEKIGEDSSLSDVFLDYVHYNLDTNKRENISETLLSSSKKLISDVHYEKLNDNKDFDWESYHSTKKRLREKIAKLKQTNLTICKNALHEIKNKNLETKDFAGGASNSISKFFEEVLKYYTEKRQDFPFPSDENSALERFQKGASSSGKSKEGLILEILEKLINDRQEIIQNHILCKKNEKLLQNILPLKINKEIQDQLLNIEEENDLVLLSKFNVLIHENLKSEPSNFIYEKIGTKYEHFFFDEFQDTSAMQWENFIPLRDHIVSSEDSSFTLVGDPKQNIYRFRGGESQLMLDIIYQNENSPVPAEIINLDRNFRSSKNIVTFNNELYRYLSKFLNEEHSNIFNEGAQQIPESKNPGRVKIHLIEKEKTKESFYEESSLLMQKDIQECLNNGYNFSDITILCRGKNDILNFTQKLSNLTVEIEGQKSYIKCISESGLTLNLSSTINAVVQFLLWKNFPKNNRFLALCLYYLNKSGRIKISNFTEELDEILKLTSKQEIYQHLKDNYNLDLENPKLNLNLYNHIEHYTQLFSVENFETDYVLSFLELVYDFSQNTGRNTKDFLKFWEEKGKDTTIKASESVDAINIMTIHKSKGLEFPIVFLPLENKVKDSFQEWYKVDDEQNIKSINIGSFDKNLEAYDVEIEKFNQSNFYKNHIDRLSLLYVATTRPVDQLFLYVQKPGKTNHLEIYDFILERKTTESDSFDFFEIENSSFKKTQKKKLIERLSEEISVNSTHEKKNNIKIATPSKNYQSRIEKVRLGILTHEILSKIESNKDFEKVIEKYLLEGIITNDEYKSIFSKIQQTITDKRYAEYFQDGLKIINERDFFFDKNQILRPDRIVKTSQGLVIIDFKTGEEKPEHQKQIDFYKKTLETFGYKVDKTVIIYL